MKSTERKFQDACTWALIDLDTEKYYSDSLLDHRACDILTHALDPEKTGRDCQHVEGPMLQLAKKNRLMRPDRQMKKPASVAKDHLSINLDDECMLSKRSPTPEEYQVPHAPKTVYEVHTKNPQTVCSTKLSFLPQQGVIKHGETGMVNEMLYYYIPRCSVKGMVEIEGEVLEVQGSGWHLDAKRGTAVSPNTDILRFRASSPGVLIFPRPNGLQFTSVLFKPYVPDI